MNESDIFSYLKKNHQGRERAITIGDLTKKFSVFNISGRAIRQLIRNLNEQGYPISTCNEGVFWSENPQDFRIQIYDLKSRIEEEQKRIKDLEKIILKLTGQMGFEFDEIRQKAFGQI
jgi:hypothetical protein